MAYVIYNRETTRLLDTGKEMYASMAAAKGALTRYENDHPDFDRTEYDIADRKVFLDSIEMWVEKTNLMSGEKFMERVNTPYFCSPSSETYWSM